MDLSKYEGKHVRIRDIYGSVFTGIAGYGNYEFLMHEYGGDEDGIFIEDCLVYNSQIASIEEITVHGTAELWTERMTLRRYCPEDAEPLYRRLGSDPEMYRYSGWNPYATPEMARETVDRFIAGYQDEHTYSWVAYLTENEGIACVTAWSAAENIGSCRVLEKAGMRLVRREEGALEVGDKTYDKLTYEYRKDR